MSEADPADRAGECLEYFAERLNRVFSLFFFRFEFREDDDLREGPGKNDRAWALQTIGNACLHETLIALRDLDDFLTPRTARTRDDDLRASDFGYDQRGGFLTAGEREQIHKLVVHSTTAGAAQQDFRWDVWELTTKCVAQSTAFLQWTEHNQSFFRVWTAAMVSRTKTRQIYDFFTRQSGTRKPAD